MPERFETFIAKHESDITRAWADRVYADRRIGLTALLSYEQLVDHLPDMLSEVSRLIDRSADDYEIAEVTRRQRGYAQVRFYQGALVDEVARELMTFRQVVEDFLWREGFEAAGQDLQELYDAVRITGRFVDEMLVQAVVIYAACLRPPVQTRGSVWPPPRRRRTDRPYSGD